MSVKGIKRSIKGCINKLKSTFRKKKKVVYSKDYFSPYMLKILGTIPAWDKALKEKKECNHLACSMCRLKGVK